MFGTIRKHSSWLWYVVAGLTIISFVGFMSVAPNRNGGHSGSQGFGVIYGQKVMPADFAVAQRAFFLRYWQQSGEWPDASRTFKQEDIERETYIELLLNRKAAKLGIHVGDDAVRSAAVTFLQSLDRSGGRAVAIDTFVDKVLTPKGLTVADFQNFLRSQLMIQQLVQTFGLPGALVSPQEVSQLYDREYQDYSAQVVFFSSSNYLAQSMVSPAVVGQFYTNYMSSYRLPDRVAVNYVAFERSNYIAQAQAEWAKTNFEEYVEAVYRQYGATEFASLKADEAKVKIRESLVEQRAATDATAAAKAFASEVFAVTPQVAASLNQVAQQKGLTVRTTLPFAAQMGPSEFVSSAAFVKSAFALSPEIQLAGPVAGQDAVYVIALARQLPAEIPSLEQIRTRVTQDCQLLQAAAMARAAGSNFAVTASIQLAAGKKFGVAATAAGKTPTVLAPFSLSSSSISEVEGEVDLATFKNIVSQTPAGHLSAFYPTQDGGFVVWVDSVLPVDTAKKSTDLVNFTGQVRRGRQNEAFQMWLNVEANRELVNTPLAKMLQAGAAKR